MNLSRKNNANVRVSDLRISVNRTQSTDFSNSNDAIYWSKIASHAMSIQHFIFTSNKKSLRSHKSVVSQDSASNCI